MVGQDYTKEEMEGKHFQTIEGQVETQPVEQRDIEKDLMDISWAETIDQLQEIYTVSYKHWITVKNKENMARLIEAKDSRKAEIESQPKEDINPETGEVK